LIRIAEADAEEQDVRPLIDRLSAACDWRFGDGLTGRYAFKDRDALLKSATAPFLVHNLIVQITKINTGIAVVVPVAKIIEVFEQPSIREQEDAMRKS